MQPSPDHRLKDIRLIASDLDNTLLTLDRRLTAQTKAAIAAVRERGYMFTLCSGRVPGMLSYYAHLLNLRGPIACANGAALADAASGEIIESHLLEYGALQPVLDFCLAGGIDSAALGKGFNLFSPNSRRIGRFMAYNVLCESAGLAPMPLDYLSGGSTDARLHGGVFKLLASNLSDAKLASLTAFLKTQPAVAATLSGPGLLEITAAGVDKGFGLERLCAARGVPLAQSLVFGDYFNDAPMFRHAGVAVAVKNAEPALKQAADFVTSSCDEDGVARFLEEHIFRD